MQRAPRRRTSGLGEVSELNLTRRPEGTAATHRRSWRRTASRSRAASRRTRSRHSVSEFKSGEARSRSRASRATSSTRNPRLEPRPAQLIAELVRTPSCVPDTLARPGESRSDLCAAHRAAPDAVRRSSVPSIAIARSYRARRSARNRASTSSRQAPPLCRVARRPEQRALASSGSGSPATQDLSDSSSSPTSSVLRAHSTGRPSVDASRSRYSTTASPRAGAVVLPRTPERSEPAAIRSLRRIASSRSTAWTPTCPFTTWVTRRSTPTLASASASARPGRARGPSARASRRSRSWRRRPGARRSRT